MSTRLRDGEGPYTPEQEHWIGLLSEWLQRAAARWKPTPIQHEADDE